MGCAAGEAHQNGTVLSVASGAGPHTSLDQHPPYSAHHPNDDMRFVALDEDVSRRTLTTYARLAAILQDAKWARLQAHIQQKALGITWREVKRSRGK